MKKIIYILVVMFTFIFGVTALYLRPTVKTVSLCDARLYNNREVSTRTYFGTLSENENDDFDYVSSLEAGCSEGANLVYSEKLKKDEKLKQLRKDIIEANKELRKTNFDKGWYLAEVDITGEVNDLLDDGITDCLPPYLDIKVKKIKQTSPIRFISRESLK